MSFASSLYVGRVAHRRLRPRAHSLNYRVFWMLLDLDEIDELSATLRLFSRNRANVFSFRDVDYGDRSGRPLREQVDQTLKSAGFETQGGPVRLLTMPRILGYAFNPLSVFFCYHLGGKLAAVLYEVHNTFGEKHAYLIPVQGEESPVVQNSHKAFHVSPFLDLDMRYEFRVVPPAEKLAVAIQAADEAGTLLVASLAGNRRPLTDRNLFGLLFTHPLLTLKVTIAIHWHALRLLMKRVPLKRHPGGPTRSVTLGGRS